jgi:hypothetical protein
MISRQEWGARKVNRHLWLINQPMMAYKGPCKVGGGAYNSTSGNIGSRRRFRVVTSTSPLNLYLEEHQATVLWAVEQV